MTRTLLVVLCLQLCSVLVAAALPKFAHSSVCAPTLIMSSIVVDASSRMVPSTTSSHVILSTRGGAMDSDEKVTRTRKKKSLTLNKTLTWWTTILPKKILSIA